MDRPVKRKEGLILFTIMLANLVGMGEMVVTPIINNLYMAFPNDGVIVNSIVSAPSLLNVAGSLAAASLFGMMGKKRTLIAGSVLFAACSLLCAFAENVWLMLGLRLAAGFGMGVVTVAATALIADLYDDESRRAAAMGYYNASMSVVGIVMTLVSGVIATMFWRYSFGLYLLCIPMVILFALILPDIRSHHEEVAAKDASAVEKAGCGRDFWKMAAVFFVYNVCNGVCLYFVSVYIAENMLGDEAFAGIASAVMTLAGLPFCIAFGAIYARLRGKSGAVMYGLAGISMIALVLNVTRVQVLVTWACLGIAYGYMFAYVNQRSTIVPPLSKVDSALGFITAAYALGAFLSTYFASACMAAMRTDRITPVFMVTGVICVVLALVELFTNKNWKAEREDA